MAKLIKSKTNDETLLEMKGNLTYKGLTLGLVAALIIVSVIDGIFMMQPKKVIGYVVEVNTLTGEQRMIEGAVTELQQYTTSEYLFLNTIRSYITALRSVYSDEAVNRDNIKKVYAYTTGEATVFVNDWYETNNPILKNKNDNERVEVSIYNTMPVNKGGAAAGEMTFQIDWTERIKTNSGRLKSEKNYRAEIKAKQYKATRVTSEENPIGLYVNYIYISEIKDGFIV